MSITLHPIDPFNKKELRQFLQFPFDLYKGNPYWVPGLWTDEYDLFSKVHNPVLKHCDLKLIIAFKDGKPAGRIAGIINHRENQLNHTLKGRFGWFDVIDDLEVTKSMFSAIEAWIKEKKMSEIEGPMSFTNLDKAGLLVEGFDQMPTIATLYNHPYYAGHLESLGYVKAVDWIEHQLNCPTELTERFVKFSEILKEKYKVKTVPIHNKKDLVENAYKMFDLINRTYKDIHGFIAFEQEQVNLYVRKYSKILMPKFISLVADEQDQLISFGLALPSLSKAFQKAKGRLLPFGWFHLLKALRKNDTLDLLLIGTDPAWRNKGVHALLFYDIMKSAIEAKIQWVESNPELETNTNVQLLWKGYEYRQHKRRRTYKKIVN